MINTIFKGDSILSSRSNPPNRSSRYGFWIGIFVFWVGSVFARIWLTPIAPAQVDLFSLSSDLSFSPSVLAARTYFEGSETIGRVGHEAILKRDIQHQLKKFALLEFVKRREEAQGAEKEQFTDENFRLFLDGFCRNENIYSQILDEYIRKLLFYNDYVVSRSKEEITEQRKNLLRAFHSDYIPQLLKQTGCADAKELKEMFEKKLDSTLEQEQRLFLQEALAAGWLEFNLGTEKYDPTVVELRRWYDANRENYRTQERVRWMKMSVLLSNHPSRAEAMHKIAYMGNAVRAEEGVANQESRFAAVARADSEDFLASKGGYCDWTRRGELQSSVLEEALFSDLLPMGHLSRVLEDEKSLTILCILERTEAAYSPFVDVQEEVREKLKSQRREALRHKYENQLAERFAVEIYIISAEERQRHLEASRPAEQSATGRFSIPH